MPPPRSPNVIREGPRYCYQRLKFRRGHSGVAKVAIARKLAVRLYWRLREAAQPNTAARMQGSPAVTVAGE